MVLPNCIFRRAKPAIFGVEVLGGRLKPKVGLLRAEDSSDLGEVQQVQDQGKAVGEAKVGAQVAVSMDKPIAGRHVFEKDILFVKVPEADAKALLTRHLDDLTSKTRSLKEYITLMQRNTFLGCSNPCFSLLNTPAFMLLLILSLLISRINFQSNQSCSWTGGNA
jgi:translation initiation factor 5B